MIGSSHALPLVLMAKLSRSERNDCCMHSTGTFRLDAPFVTNTFQNVKAVAQRFWKINSFDTCCKNGSSTKTFIDKDILQRKTSLLQLSEKILAKASSKVPWKERSFRLVVILGAAKLATTTTLPEAEKTLRTSTLLRTSWSSSNVTTSVAQNFSHCNTWPTRISAPTHFKTMSPTGAMKTPDFPSANRIYHIPMDPFQVDDDNRKGKLGDCIICQKCPTTARRRTLFLHCNSGW